MRSRFRTRCSSETRIATLYRAHRERAFIVAVNCGSGGRDLLLRVDEHGPARGRRIRPRPDGDPGRRPACVRHRGRARTAGPGGARRVPCGTQEARTAISRPPRGAPTAPASRWGARSTRAGVPELLARSLEHPRWDEVASGVWACANCTMVCPTCFCRHRRGHDGSHRRSRRAVATWDSCFTLDSHPSTGAASGLGERAIPAVADAQAVDLVRSIRHIRMRGLRPMHHVVPGRDRSHAGGRRNCGRARDRMDSLERISCHTIHFLPASRRAYLKLIAGCAPNVHVRPGAYLAREGEPADRFFAIRGGRVAIETHAPRAARSPSRRSATGEILGWSWLFPPYVWQFDARARGGRARATAFDGACLRQVRRRPALGYELMKRSRAIMVTRRLEATRLPTPRRVWAPRWRTARRSLPRADLRVTQQARETARCANVTLEPRTAAAPRVPAGPVQHGVRLRHRRDADLDQRRSGEPDVLVHTVRAVGA